MRILPVLALAGFIVVGLVACSDESDGSFPADPQLFATELIENDDALRAAVAAWRETEDPPRTECPPEVAGSAQYLQDAARNGLAGDPSLLTSTVALLPPRLGAQVRSLTIAVRKLHRLAGGGPRPKLRTGPPEPLADLIGYYRAAHRRYRIGWNHLGAINLVETIFGRIKNQSVAGAKGPMQFIPSTWKIYGHGGDINDPRDAIPAAARLLRDNGAPGSYSRALYAYNPDRLYVDAVRRYARLIAQDPQAIYFLYCWRG